MRLRAVLLLSLFMALIGVSIAVSRSVAAYQEPKFKLHSSPLYTTILIRNAPAR